MFDVYARLLVQWLPIILSLFVASFVVGAIFRLEYFQTAKNPKRVFPWAVLGLAIGSGLWFAWQKRSIFDDAFIAFRFGKNFLAGHGLVFNIGERVEGYTNFLWTLLISALTYVSGVDMPLVAFFGCLACFVGNLITVFLIGRRLSAPEPSQTYFPLAVLWLACQSTFFTYGTSGLETMFASLLVNIAVYFLVTRQGVSQGALTGLFLILATFTRPDHSLFYAVMGLVFLQKNIVAIFRAKTLGINKRDALFAALKQIAAFSAPFTLYAAYLVWKYSYYGDIVPNTYYALSAGLTYFSQGFVYSLATLFSAHLLVILPMFLIWMATPAEPRFRDFKVFASLAVFVYCAYVIKIGGDKMVGRFFVSLLPLIILGVEQWVHRIARTARKRPAWIAVAASALVIATIHGVPIIAPTKTLWKVADPSTYYSVRSLFPLAISLKGHSGGNRLAGPMLLKETLTDKGIQPVFLAGGLGIFSYYTELPVIDPNGLTDSFIAHLELKTRGRPGHERHAPKAYLDYRNIRFARQRLTPEKAKYAGVSIKGKTIPSLTIYRYDRDLLRSIARKSPEFKYTNFLRYFDENVEKMKNQNLLTVARTVVELDHFYFSLNPAPKRRKRLTDRFIRLWDFENRRYPKGTKATGDFKSAFLRPVKDMDLTLSNYQGETLIATSKNGRGICKLPAFTITGNTVGFLFGGDQHGKQINARLLVEGVKVYQTNGTGSDTLDFVLWNVRKHKGKTAQVILEDSSRKGRLLFDMFFEAQNKPASPEESGSVSK